MTLRQQIVAGFGVLLVPLFLVALVAFAVVGRLGGVVDDVLAENDRSLRAVATMDVSLERLDSAALLGLLGRTDEAEEIADVHRARFREAFAEAASNITVDGEAETIGEVGDAFEAYAAAFEVVVRSSLDSARVAYTDDLVPAFGRVRNGLERLRDLNREAALVTARRAGSVARWGLWGVAGVLLLAVLLTAWTAFKLSNEIVESQKARSTAHDGEP